MLFKIFVIIDTLINNGVSEDLSWDLNGVELFFTSEGQLKIPKAKPNKERKVIELESSASPDDFRFMSKDKGVLWHKTMKGTSPLSLAKVELANFAHPRFLREFMNYRVFFLY